MYKCVKSLLFIVNLLFSLLGIALFAFGIYVLVAYKQLNDFYPAFSSYVIASTIVLGAVIFLISFCGCFGAIKEINCMLTTFGITMIILTAVKIGIGVYLALKTPAVKDEITAWINEMPAALEKKDIPIHYHALEFAGACCGTDGPKSYEAAGMEVSEYCCPISMDKVVCTSNSTNVYRKGCREVPQTLDKILMIAMYCAFGVGVFEFLSFVSAMYLMCSRGKREDYYGYD